MKRIILLLFVGMLAACAKPVTVKPLHALDIDWQHPDADFNLTDFNGKPRSLADFRDKVAVVFFGYTHCPDVCPTTLADLARAMKQLGPDAKDVQVIFITLDPARDTAAKLKEFVPYFDSAFLGLRGDAQATAEAAKSFGVHYDIHKEKNGDYLLDHSDSTYLIGIGGKPIWMSRYHQRTDYLVADIKRLVAAGKAH